MTQAQEITARLRRDRRRYRREYLKLQHLLTELETQRDRFYRGQDYWDERDTRQDVILAGVN